MMSAKDQSNNDITIETPPSSPPTVSMSASGADEPPSLTSSVSQSLSLSPTSQPETAKAAEGTAEAAAPRGHIRMATPSTPIPVEALGLSVKPNAAVSMPYSTPSRGGAPFLRHGGGSREGAPMSDLTPVISNSGAYVDTNLANSMTRPGMPGLPAASPSRGPRGMSRMSGQASAALLGEDTSGGTSDDATGGGLSVRGLRQRRLPLPRAGLPPAKRSSIEGGAAPSSGTASPAEPDLAGLASILRMPSSSNGSSESSSLYGENLKISPFSNSSPTTTTLSPAAALSRGTSEDSVDYMGNLLGEKLSMPSYSDESSSVDTSNGGGERSTENTRLGPGNSASIFHPRENNLLNLSAPIELRPDRKFFSFQGSNQYKHRIENAPGPPRLATIIASPTRRPPSSPSKRSATTAEALTSPQRSSNSALPQQQYQPLLRSQHGVRDMADSKELDAIFKAPRNTKADNEQQHATVVSPPKAPATATFRQVGQPQLFSAQPMLSNIPKEESNDEDLAVPYPVESQFSIPSIRLANHVNNGGSNPLDGSFASYADFSEYTDEGASLDDESYYSFLADDDDTASLSSRGSVDSSVRKRRISGMFRLQRKASIEAAMEAAAAAENGAVTTPKMNAVYETKNVAGPAMVSPPPAIAPSNSFLERVQRISIGNDGNGTRDGGEAHDIVLPPSLDRRANTFDSEAPPPILSVEATTGTTDDAAFEHSRSRRHHHRSGRQRRRRQRRKERAAGEWLQELQVRSSNVASDSGGFVIAEAASSKFLSVGGDLGSGVGSRHPLNLPSMKSGMTSDDVVTKALGMPHPLCRSSTIEAGSFVNRSVVALSSNNSIALTSSGSGD
mmetsp:Transcript_40774/g.69640  ORF Transcript_40774/g.69640 Transcript_40774/m.69640 type:complete len:845 (-) Transcript_40774:170-2704(-)